MKIITAPSAGIPNLHTQKGVFTLYQPPSLVTGGRVDRTPLDALIPTLVGAAPLFKRFTLRVDGANELLRLLFVDGISGATVYAGYLGAARATMDQMHWDSLGSARRHMAILEIVSRVGRR